MVTGFYFDLFLCKGSAIGLACVIILFSILFGASLMLRTWLLVANTFDFCRLDLRVPIHINTKSTYAHARTG